MSSIQLVALSAILTLFLSSALMLCALITVNRFILLLPTGPVSQSLIKAVLGPLRTALATLLILNALILAIVIYLSSRLSLVASAVLELAGISFM